MQKKSSPIYVTRPSLPPVEEYERYVREIFESRFLTNCGALHRRLERGLCETLGTEHLTLFTNGHLALEACIQAFGFGGGEIITTPFTFVSTSHAIVRSGLTPVFCDIEPDYYTLDPARIEAAITPNTRAILPVHVYGNPCLLGEIERVAAKHNLPVIYDAAHAFGVTVGGRGIASFGDASMFSFHATKSFNAIEGGGVACASEAFAKTLRRLRNFGYDGDEEIELAGGNAKMTEFQAAMGLCNLEHFAREIEKRARVEARYRENLADIPGLSLRPIPRGVARNYAYLPVTFEPEAFGRTRDEVAEALIAYNIYPRKYFYPLTSLASCYRDRFAPGDTPLARLAAEQVLTLPMYADLALSDVDDICQIVCACRR